MRPCQVLTGTYNEAEAEAEHASGRGNGHDGNVYIHWEFHRNEIYACSGQGIRPYILKE